MTEIVTLAGLDEQRLEWVARLYGRADPKYGQRDFLEHLFLRNPVGPSLHAFAVDGERPVGHCCIVRTRARLGDDDLPSGKLEALWFEESHRGRQPGGESLVRTLLTRLYEFSDAQGLELVHALVTPRIGRIIEFAPLTPVGERSRVSVVSGRARGLPSTALALAQRAAREVGATPLADATLREPTPSDADLAAVERPPEGRWAILAEDAWSWYCSSPLVRVLELDRSRALVQVPGAHHEPLRLVGWSAERPGLRAALRLLAAAGRLARARGAATLRFQPWRDDAAERVLVRAARLTGFVPRGDLTTVWVHAADRALVRAEAAVSTPFLYLGF